MKEPGPFGATQRFMCYAWNESILFAPTCRQRFDRPENHFVYSKCCPECAQANEPLAATCRSCGTSTRWDDRTKYEAFVDHMKDTSRVYLLKGIAQLGVGLVCVPLGL